MTPKAAAETLIETFGRRRFEEALTALTPAPGRAARALLAQRQREAFLLLLDRLRREEVGALRKPEREMGELLAASLPRLLPAAGAALAARLAAPLGLPWFFHLLRLARRYEEKGHPVWFAGLRDGAPFDLDIGSGSARLAVVAEAVSAEEGRDLPRAAFLALTDELDPDLQSWLAAHPGRYLLKMTLPPGMRVVPGEETAALAALQREIRALLTGDRSEAASALLRLDPLLLAGARASELGLLDRLRTEFGPEAHLAVPRGTGGMVVMAARTARGNQIARLLAERAAGLAPSRLAGCHAGLIAFFLEDTDLVEWQYLRRDYRIEIEARRFLLSAAARPVAALSCASRAELFALPPPQAAAEGEIRFASPHHPAVREKPFAELLGSAC